jgi:hypothetical protein
MPPKCESHITILHCRDIFEVVYDGRVLENVNLLIMYFLNQETVTCHSCNK